MSAKHRAGRRLLPAAVFILLLATFTRFHLLEAQSFWNDEGNSARLSERSITAILEGTASDIHPPLYYLALRGWRELLGESEFALRSLSAYVGLLTVAMVMALALGAIRRGRNRGAFLPAAVAGLLAAVSPVLIYYSQETRMYALLALLAAMSVWALFNWARGDGRRWGLFYTILLAAGLYTHYFFPAIIVAQGAVIGLWWLAWRREDRRAAVRRVALWMGMVVAAVLLYLPWAPIFLRQVGGRSDAPAGLFDFAIESGRWLALGSTIGDGEGNWAAVAGLVLALLGAIAVGRAKMKQGRRAAAWLVWPALFLIPLLLMFLVGATDPAFFKFMLAVVPILAVQQGLAWLDESDAMYSPRPKSLESVLRQALVAALTVAVLAGSFASLGNMYFDPAFARADYRAMAASIAAENHPNAAVILVAPNQWEAFTYYHRQGAPVYPLPRGRPDPAVLEPELERILAAHDRIYALFWGETQRDPQSIIERRLAADAFKVSEEWVGDVRFVVYATMRETTAAPTPSSASFSVPDGEPITLHEFTFWPAEARPGDVVQVRLGWSAAAPPTRAYKVFLHLLDGAGNVVAQRDGEPVGGSRPTTSWSPGERIVDNHGILLPPDLPPGDYTLRVGLYDALEPGSRLAVEGDDGIALGVILVR